MRDGIAGFFHKIFSANSKVNKIIDKAHRNITKWRYILEHNENLTDRQKAQLNNNIKIATNNIKNAAKKYKLNFSGDSFFDGIGIG